MRVMQIVTNFRPGGIQRHVLDLTADLRERGHHVGLAGDDGDWRGQAEGPEYVPLQLNGVTWAGGSLARRLAHVPPAAMRLRKALAAQRIDLIHAHETAPALVARLGGAGTGRPLVMTFHGAAPEREAEVARIARLCTDITVSPSRTALARLIALGLPEAQTRTIGLGVADLPHIDPAMIAARRAALLGGFAGPLVFSLSRLSIQKGLDDMIAVARRVVAAHPGAVFAVAGGGPLATDVAGWVAASGLGEQFRLLGPVTNVGEYLRAADLYLLTSRWENLPISIVEAFRAALPVVATDCGGVCELVDETVGALRPVGDVDGLARAVSLLLANSAERTGKGMAARARSCENRFDPAHVHRQFEALYGELLQHRR